MEWYEIAVLSVGVPVTLETARRTIWQWIKGLVRGTHGVVKFGQALPDLSNLPGLTRRLEAQHLELKVEVAAARQDLRDHMGIEDEAALLQEKAWVMMIQGQSDVVQSVSDLRHELNTVRQIVMNSIELGSGDRWRLSHHSPESEPT